MSAPESVAGVVDHGGALVGYLPVGFPDLQTSIDAAVALVENGVDALELGLPYSDPVMDGVAIQKATQAAIAAGFRVSDVFRAVEGVRSRVDAPVLVMTYWNPVVQYGVDRFADALRDAGGAGLITPDITPDSAADWIATSDRTGLDRVFLAAPSSTDERLAATVAASRGSAAARPRGACSPGALRRRTGRSSRSGRSSGAAARRRFRRPGWRRRQGCRSPAGRAACRP